MQASFASRSANDLESLKEKARASLRDALDLIPAERRSAFDHAVKHVPRLVEKESNPDRYLQFENYNSWVR
jgi:molecular chaperone DnaK (HSP70)